MVSSDPSGTLWVDIQPLLAEACDSLEVGQMIHGEAFSLFEAMSAVELGDAKMDSGIKSACITLDELAQQTPPVDKLTPETVLPVVDRLLQLQASWHQGSSLAQTVYACLYMMEPDRFMDNVYLYGFCQGLGATCLTVKSLVMQGYVCEEEDFNVFCMGLPLDDSLKQLPEARCLQALQLAIDGATSISSKAKANPSIAVEASAEVVTNLAARLQLQQQLHLGLAAVMQKDLGAAAVHFKSALTHLEQCKASTLPVDAPAAPGFNPAVNRLLLAPAYPKAVKALSMSEAWQYYSTLLHHLITATTVSSVTGYSSLKQFLYTFSHSSPSPLARSALHYLLASKSYGAAQQQQPAGAGGAAAASMAANSGFSDGTGVGDLPHWAPGRSLVCEALRVPAQHTYSADVEMFLEQASIAVSNWVQAQLLNSARCRRRLRRGLEDWGNLYQHALNADFCPDWQAWIKSANWNWSTSNENGEEVQGLLSTWVEQETTLVQLQHLLMGFEQDLYQPREYDMLYWYCDYLYSVALNCTKTIFNAYPAPGAKNDKGNEGGRAAGRPKSGHKEGKEGKEGGGARSGPSLPSRGKGGKKKEKGWSSRADKSKTSAAATTPAPAAEDQQPAAAAAAGSTAAATAPAVIPPPPPSMSESQYTDLMGAHAVECCRLESSRLLCQGMLRVMVGLRLAAAVRTLDPPFNTPLQHFDQRFAAFHCLIRPEPLSFQQYCASMDTKSYSAVQLLGMAGEALTQMRRNQAVILGTTLVQFPKTQDDPQQDYLRSLEKVAHTNAIAVGLLGRQLLAAEPGTPLPYQVSYDFSHHPNFPVLQLKAKKEKEASAAAESAPRLPAPEATSASA